MLVLLNCALVLYSVLFSVRLDSSEQMKYFLGWFAVEVFVISVWSLFVIRIMIPLWSMSGFCAARKELQAVVAKSFPKSLESYDPFGHYDSIFGAHSFVDEKESFNAAQYFFVSKKVAEYFPELIEFEILGQFICVTLNRQQAQAVGGWHLDSIRSLLLGMVQALAIVCFFVIDSIPEVQYFIVNIVSWLTFGCIANQRNSFLISLFAMLLLCGVCMLGSLVLLKAFRESSLVDIKKLKRSGRL